MDTITGGSPHTASTVALVNRCIARKVLCNGQSCAILSDQEACLKRRLRLTVAAPGLIAQFERRAA